MDMKHTIFGIGHDNLGWISDNWISQQIHINDLDPKKVDYLNYPYGYDHSSKLIMYTSDLLNKIILSFFKDPILSFNIFLLIKLSLASLAMFILIKYLVNDAFIAFIIGFFYAFSPYFVIMSKAYGGTYISFLFPIVVWRIIVLNDNPDLKNFIFFVISYILFYGENYYYSYFISITFFLSIITFYFFPRSIRWGFVGRSIKDFISKRGHASPKIIISGLLIGLGVSVFSFAVYERLASHIEERVFSLEEAISRSVDPVFYFLPSVTSSFLGGYFKDFALSRLKHLEVYELAVYLGIIPILFIAGTLTKVIFFRDNILSPRTRTYFVFFCVSAIYSIILALGPEFGLSYVFFKIAPMFRFICRYHVVTIFCVLVLFGISLRLFSNFIERKTLRVALIVLIALGVFLEYGDFTDAKLLNIYDHMPEVYKYLAKDREHYPILELNNKDWPSQAHLMAYQTFHGKKIMGGTYQTFRENIFEEDVQKKYRDMGFKYVVVITKWKPVTYPPLQVNTGDKGIPLEPIQAFGYLKLEKEFSDSLLYRFTEDKTDSLIGGGQHATFYFSEGFWGQPDFLKNGEIRWMSGKTAVVKIYIPKDAYLPGPKFNTRLKFMGRSFHIPRHVSLLVNGVEQSSLVIDNPDEYSADLNLKKGVNTLVFRTNEKLINIGKTLNNEDNRDVALQLGRFKLTPLLK